MESLISKIKSKHPLRALRSRFSRKRRAARNRNDEIARGEATYSRLRRCKTPLGRPRTDTGGLRTFDVDQDETCFSAEFPGTYCLVLREQTRLYIGLPRIPCCIKYFNINFKLFLYNKKIMFYINTKKKN